MKKAILFALSVCMMSSCVSKKKFLEVQAEYSNFKASTRNGLTKTKAELKDCAKAKETCEATAKIKDRELEIRAKHIKNLEEQIEYLKKTNTKMLDRMADLSIVSKAGAESIKKSLETLNEQNQYIESLNTTIQRKDSLNLSLVVAVKRAFAELGDDDLSVKVKRGLVYISIADKTLFPSGGVSVPQRAENMLEKLAKILNDHRELELIIEGHTDTAPVANECLKDTWDLSAKRATTVVKLLQTRFGVSPDRMTAGGRAEFAPKDAANSEAARKLNRRTEIIVMPKLDQFFQALTNGQAK